jgi:GGDEF domain-containing protein
VSFVGVPVYFRGNVVGVLCADSKEQNAYTDITVGFFGHFTKLISGLVLSYTSKFDLQQSARTLEAVQAFRTAAAESEPTIGTVIRHLFDAVIKQMDVSTVGVCGFDPEKRVWTVRDAKSVMPEYAQLVGAPIDLENALVGECIRNGESIAVSVESSTIRVTPTEPEIDLCQFVALPMRSLLHTHGALFMENHKGTITSQDVAVAELLADLAGEMIAGIRETTRDHDADTPAGTTSANIPQAQASASDAEDLFTQRLREEVARAADYDVPLTLCYIMVDGIIGTTGDESASVLAAVVKRVQRRIKEQVREYDLVAQLSDDTVAVALVAYNAQEAQFWTESLRRDIGSSTVEAAGKTFSATVSVGVAQHVPGDGWQVLLENAQTALDISARLQNKVTVYS